MVKTIDSHLKAVPWVLVKPLYVVTSPRAYYEVRVDHVAGPLHILLGEIERMIWFDIICLKCNQFEMIDRVCLYLMIIWWCLYVLESFLQSIPKFVLVEIIVIKFREIMKPCYLIHNPPCRTSCRLFIHEVSLSL